MNDLLTAAIIGVLTAIPPVLMALAAWLQSRTVGREVHEVHKQLKDSSAMWTCGGGCKLPGPPKPPPAPPKPPPS